MLFRQPLTSSKLFTTALLLWGPAAKAALTAGALAVVGYNDNASENSGTDSFALVATETINANEVIYLTNNGWNNADRKFQGVSLSGDVGSGIENLVKLTITDTIAAGTIIKSTDLTNTLFSWTTSGTIPMPLGSTGTFSDLDLKFGGSGGGSWGDQIYLFQVSSDSNPLLHVSNFVYAISFGDQGAGNVNWYTPQELDRGGDLPDGTVAYSPYDSSNYFTVDTLSDVENSEPNDNTALGLDPSSHFYDGTFGLDLTHDDVIALQTSGGTKADWLRLFNDASHWAPTSNIFDDTGIYANGLTVGIVPEPSRAMLLLLGSAFGVFRRRRENANV